MEIKNSQINGYLVIKACMQLIELLELSSNGKFGEYVAHMPAIHPNKVIRYSGDGYGLTFDNLYDLILEPNPSKYNHYQWTVIKITGKKRETVITRAVDKFSFISAEAFMYLARSNMDIELTTASICIHAEYKFFRALASILGNEWNYNFRVIHTSSDSIIIDTGTTDKVISIIKGDEGVVTVYRTNNIKENILKIGDGPLFYTLHTGMRFGQIYNPSGMFTGVVDTKQRIKILLATDL